MAYVIYLIVYSVFVFLLGTFVERWSTFVSIDQYRNEGYDEAKALYADNVIGNILAEYENEIMVEHTDGSVARYRKVEV